MHNIAHDLISSGSGEISTVTPSTNLSSTSGIYHLQLLNPFVNITWRTFLPWALTGLYIGTCIFIDEDLFQH